ncbi:DUF1501 domain-containing protein [Paracrocinitomix mangrovi]|uniref:DUF1501 domain-containing protein n=1 Tax=Paracrocinitomix mangrovi TaxID=2862509 RepID=UPI001C8DC058|nr:DUF1501 domain-containing protein [Paracrocinitomix mangrovi]UKN03371.1 DUF1501 domain-containing protein [Paracrocinitomix mangrovi]
MNRREFLKRTGIITAGTIMIPSFLRANMFSAKLMLSKKRLVVIQLSGGNDGLNTVVPYGLDGYYNNRSGIGISAEELLKIGDQFGFHPKLAGLHDLHEKGLLAIINSVGYPNPNRSHFRSMDIWHTASDSNEYKTTGWLGRYMDSNCHNAYEGIEIGGQLSLAMKGQEQSGIALTNPKAFYDTIHSDFFNELGDPVTENGELNYLYKVFNDTKNSAKYIFDQYKLKNNPALYQGAQFGQQLKQIATLIKSDIQTPVFYTSLGGFDTHVNQPFAQSRLFEQLNGGVTSFIEDLEKDDLMKDTTIVIFSEFGRRLKQNASRGTDHGAANVMFVIDKDLESSAIKQYNQIDLEDLQDGDPKFKVDFRSVYQEMLAKTLEVDAEKVLGKKFNNLGLWG